MITMGNSTWGRASLYFLFLRVWGGISFQEHWLTNDSSVFWWILIYFFHRKVCRNCKCPREDHQPARTTHQTGGRCPPYHQQQQHQNLFDSIDSAGHPGSSLSGGGGGKMLLGRAGLYPNHHGAHPGSSGVRRMYSVTHIRMTTPAAPSSPGRSCSSAQKMQRRSARNSCRGRCLVPCTPT